jgi:multidrug efflux pump subunit AcrA (membrane-fusion protein)
MNRSILIIICDFLLVTLVAFSNFDGAPPAETQTRVASAPKAIGGNPDLMGTLKLALEDEKQTREKLTSDLRGQEQALAEREQKIKEFQENLRRTEEQARQIDQQRAALAQQVTASQASLKEVQSKLSEASTQNLLSQEKMDALQADLKRREQETQTLQKKLGETEKAAQVALTEKQQLSAQLQVSEAEKRLTREQVAELRGTVATEKQEKAKLQETATALATNVGVLAQKSGELTQEIRDNRALAPNAIFNQFLSNRITARFDGARSGVFGREVNKEKVSQCVLFTDGAQTYTLYHVEETPLQIWNPGTDWNRLTAVLQRGNVAFSGVRLSFLAQDPRVVVIPIGEAQAKQYGVKIYKAAADPYKFQDAVIVGANEGYYGECKFQIDPGTPNYVKVDRNLLKGLFGKFNPSRGDLVFTRTGELLGIMVNGEYCAVLNKVVPTRTIQLGNEIASQQTGQMLAQLYDRIFQMPVKLQ